MKCLKQHGYFRQLNQPLSHGNQPTTKENLSTEKGVDYATKEIKKENIPVLKGTKSLCFHFVNYFLHIHILKNVLLKLTAVFSIEY